MKRKGKLVKMKEMERGEVLRMMGRGREEI